METLRYINHIKNTRLLFANVPVFDQKAFLKMMTMANGQVMNGFTPKLEMKTVQKREEKKEKHEIMLKPPPIFVYSADDSTLFNKFSVFLQTLLPSDVYTTASLSKISLIKHPWIDERPACFIILNVVPFDEFMVGLLHAYLERNGKIIFASQTDSDSQVCLEKWQQVFANSLYSANVIFLDYEVATIIKEEPRIFKESLSRLDIELAKDHHHVEYTKGYLIAANDRMLWNLQGIRYGEYLSEKPILFLQPSIVLQNNPNVLPKANEKLLPIEVCRRKNVGIPEGSFNLDEYFGILNTQTLGKVILYIPVCESTMEVSRSLSTLVNDAHGIMVIAGHQTKSRGRSGNQWLSVPGSALFNFNFHVSMKTQLGQSLGYVQHIVAAAIVDAINYLAGQETDVKVKWPNDVYYKRESKIGGILVQSSIKGDTFQCLIGIGLNIANSKPTICINDILPEECEKLTVEAVLAEFMNKFEEYVEFFEDHGRYKFLQKYYQFWLHSNEEVTVDMDGEQERVLIQGLDEHGYLEVKSKKTGALSHVTDNGNSFDMMKGLIRAKFA